jgi:ribosomal protein L16 Arg81 hydroxylase
LHYPHSQNQIAYENLHSNLRPKSKYENIIDGLQPYNEYQTIINESQSEPQYDANDFLNMEPLPPNKLDRLINRINEHILKQNELNEWFKNSIDKQTRMIEELKEISNNQNKLMEKIFEFMNHIEKK